MIIELIKRNVAVRGFVHKSEDEQMCCCQFGCRPLGDSYLSTVERLVPQCKQEDVDRHASAIGKDWVGSAGQIPVSI